MTRKPRIRAEDLRRMLSEDGDLLKTIIEQTVQQVLEAEIDEALQAGRGERSEQQLGYRSGYYGRTLVTYWQDRAAGTAGPTRAFPYGSV